MEHYSFHVFDYYGQDYEASYTLFTTLEKACDYADKYFARYRMNVKIDRDAAKSVLKNFNVYDEGSDEHSVKFSIYRYTSID